MVLASLTPCPADARTEWRELWERRMGHWISSMELPRLYRHMGAGRWILNNFVELLFMYYAICLLKVYRSDLI